MKSTTDKDTNPLYYIYQEYDVSAWYMSNVHYELYSHFRLLNPPEHVCKEVPLRNSPRIAAFIGEESQQYLILLEQRVLCQLPSFQLAVFIVFSTYYCFHLEYPVRNVMLFFQDYKLSFPDGLRRPATYLAMGLDINYLRFNYLNCPCVCIY